jgi:hypothetical protein
LKKSAFLLRCSEWHSVYYSLRRAVEEKNIILSNFESSFSLQKAKDN